MATWKGLLKRRDAYKIHKLLHSSNRGIFVYNICLITISDTVSDGATKRLNIFCNVSLITLEYVHYVWFVLTVEVF